MAFKWSKKPKFSKKLEKIGEEAFRNCSKIEGVEIPDSVYEQVKQNLVSEDKE